MKLPLTLSLYIGRSFLFWICVTIAAIIIIIGLLDLMELFRRTASKNVPVLTVLQMMLLKLPNMMEKVLPYCVLIGGILAHNSLARSNETTVVKSSGVSVWQFLMPAFIVTIAIGVLFVGFVNPISSIFISKYDKLESRYIGGRSAQFAVSASGVWFRELEENRADVSEYIITIRAVENDKDLKDLSIFVFDERQNFKSRIDAKTANFNDGILNLRNAILFQVGQTPEKFGEYNLNTSLNLQDIKDSLSPAETLSFWELPGFIDTLEKAGFSALKHKLHLHALLCLPLTLCAMIIIGGAFAAKFSARKSYAKLIVAAILAGFMFNFLSNVVFALGLSGALPLVLAAWAPGFIALMLGTAFLVHFEF